MLAGNTRDEGKLFPTLSCRSSGGSGSGRLLNDATVFSTAFNYDPNAAPQIDARAVDSRRRTCRPTTPVDRLQRDDRHSSTQIFFLAQPRQRARTR